MRASTLTALALPVLAQAQDSLFAQYKAKVQNMLGQLSSLVPPPASVVPETVEEVVPEVLLNKRVLKPLELASWKETLYEPVEEAATVPEEWWVFITGNQSCGGHCTHAETVWNETASKFAKIPSAPHTALLDCDNEPILCSIWSCSPGAIWSFDMLPVPANTTIRAHRLNLTSVSVDDLLQLQVNGTSEWMPLEGFLHPLDGLLAKYDVQVPFGYAMWGFNQVPQWALMLSISFFTRFFMNRRMAPAAPSTPAAAPEAAAQVEKEKEEEAANKE
ncbi:hypothetical protein TD95_001932 [Thielaviopsis punctulata]|uniref:Uncharacterized protein n=1 Tax=Thielaviopsis punctulata TaxID=72032 RepID=A0A0F4ZFI0_9PEZI|nr:hypothetical protein TD95_001932 [Thielaviopsis punctulata]